MKYLVSLLIAIAHVSASAQTRPSEAPTWPRITQLITEMNAAQSLADIQQILQAHAPLVLHDDTEAMLSGALQGGGLNEQQTIVLTLARETVVDARAGGLTLAATTLGVRVTILQLRGAQTPADVRAVLVARRDVTSSPQLTAAFTRIGQQPTVSAAALQEMATAFREANSSPDAAVARLVRLANSGNAAAAGATPAPGSGAAGGAAATGGAALVGHWRCTVSRGGGAGLSMTSDYHMVLNADGTFRSWRHSMTVTSFSGNEETTPEEVGRWSVRGGVLVLVQADATNEVRFQRSGDTIVLPDESERRVWERIR